MGDETFYGKGPRPLLWASLRTAREKIIVNLTA